jgi:hypothetical protein
MNTLQMAKRVLFHPVEFFEDIQGRGKWHQALIIIGLSILARFASLMLVGFHYENKEAFEISIIIEALWIVVPWLTWTIANWGVSTILDGEGKFKDIFVGSAFTLMPYIVLIVPLALLSNVLSYSEKSFYTGVTWFVYLWVIFLILMKVKVIHDFEIKKMVSITFLTILGMFIIWFIGLLIFGLVNQTINFVVDIFKEITFRM